MFYPKPALVTVAWLLLPAAWAHPHAPCCIRGPYKKFQGLSTFAPLVSYCARSQTTIASPVCDAFDTTTTF